MFFQNIKKCIRTTIIAVVLLGPLFSLILKGFQIEFAPLRTLTLGAIIFIANFLFLFLKEREWGKKIIFWLKPRPYQTVEVIKIKPHRIFYMIFVFLGALLPFLLGKYALTVAIFACIYILLGLGLNIVVGLAGILNLGFAAFYAIGAYTYALLEIHLHLGFWWSLPIGSIVSGLFGALLAFPVLRMFGDYLAIVTLGFGEIVRLIITNWSSFTGGPNGLSTVAPTFFGLEFTRVARENLIPFHQFFNIPYDIKYRYIFIYWLLFTTLCIILTLVIRLQRMPIGRAWEALREDEIACRSLGINHVTAKLWAFSISAMIGGIAGVFFACFEGFINPTSFTFVESALILSIVVLGGMGQAFGVVLAAIILTLLPEILREFSEYRMLLFGGLMALMMIWRPQGLIRVMRPWIPKKIKTINI